MSVQDRLTDTLSRANVFTGLPQVEFSPQNDSGGYDAYRNLGIVDTAELQKTLDTIQLINASSGFQVVEREEVSRLEIALAVGLFKFDAQNMRLFLGAESITDVPGGTGTATNEIFSVLADDRFGGLTQRMVTAITGINPREVTDEQVGVGDASSGGTTGDFNLDYPIDLLADLSGGTFTVNGVDKTGVLVSGTSPAVGEIAVELTPAGGVSRLTFGTNEIPASGSAIVAGYTPSWAIGDFTENDDYVLEPLNGGIRFLASPTGGKKVAAAAVDDSVNGTGAARPAQLLDVDYSYTIVTLERMSPFTQNTFAGRARISQLTDLGVNFIWGIPSVSFRITDDAFTWVKDNFASGTLIMNILSDGSASPYGEWDHYPETP
jgi:hypothetical protein